jgi:predicted kinase
MGLPGSGKTTWAKQYQEDHPNVIRVNKDTLREMLHNGEYTEQDHLVILVRDYIIGCAIIYGSDVIIDDTNFNKKHHDSIERIAENHGITTEIKDFTNVPLEECIKRDAKRDKPVGEDVIRKMYDQYLNVQAGKGKNKRWKQL